MDILYEVMLSLWNQNFTALSNPDVVWIIYVIMFFMLFLENALLPASFLPGDTLLLLAGGMISENVMHFIPTILILSTAASLGTWISYLQGKWLGNTKIIKSWLIHVPIQYHQRSLRLFKKHGIMALLIVRFLAFVRTILPIMIGIYKFQKGLFQFINWLSSFLWVGILITIGYTINQVPFIKHYQNKVITILLILPIILMLTGLVGVIIIIWKKYRRGTRLN